jgi:hypothetical protein
MMKKLLIASLSLVILACEKQNSPFFEYQSATSPIMLGNGTLSIDSVQWNNVFVTKTKEMFITKMGKSASIIYKMDYENGAFKNETPIDFPAGEPHSDVYVNPDGNLMLFSSLMREHEKDTVTDWNIWQSVRKEGTWQSPTPFFDNNIEGNEFYPSLTRSGNLYFAVTPHGSQNSDLYVSEYKNGKYMTPKVLPTNINTNNFEGDAFVSPDESFLIFAGFDRKVGFGKSDLFISFNTDGSWSDPVWMGKDINSAGYDGSPFVTDDGQYLIFTSSRGSTDENTFFNHYIVRFDANEWKYN